MRILAIADEESRLIWDYYQPGMLKDIDLILSAGDLSNEYLTFLVTMSQAPLLYIHGNHDGRYRVKPPEGCICIEDKIYTYRGLRILGLGGSFRYNYGPHQYSETEMRRRVRRLTLPLLYHKGFDILLSHAPARDFHDGLDLPHRGFQVFNKLIERYQPAYHIHGHIHKTYYGDFFRQDKRGQTTVINAFERYIIEIPD